MEIRPLLDPWTPNIGKNWSTEFQLEVEFHSVAHKDLEFGNSSLIPTMRSAVPCTMSFRHSSTAFLTCSSASIMNSRMTTSPSHPLYPYLDITLLSLSQHRGTFIVLVIAAT